MSNDNYIDCCLQDGKLVRWNDLSMPIKIFIDKVMPGADHDSDSYFIRQVKSAIVDWQTASEKRISTIIVNNKSDADITVEWVWKYKSELEAGMCAGNCLLKASHIDDCLKKAEITINLPLDRPIADLTEFYPVILHEFGHSFGIYDHSPEKTDIMYYAVGSEMNTLSKRDINTIKLFYTVLSGGNLSTIESLSKNPFAQN